MAGENTQRLLSVQMRVNEEEYSIIDFKASALGLAISNYMRMVCLHANIDISLQAERPVTVKEEGKRSGQREKICQTRVTEEEYKFIEDKAAKLGLHVSNYARMVSIHANVLISIQPQSTRKEESKED